MPDPFFSVIVTTFNRARIVGRCLDSCLSQDFADFELVVVDDGSSDETVEVVTAIGDERIRVVRHERNRGINPARHTGVESSRGEWIVVVDSDDELLPGALARLHEIIATLPPEVRGLRSRLIRDSGRVTPTFVPDGPYGYEGRIRWAEAEGGNDAARCLHRSVFAASPYLADRRGAMETLFELNLAEATTQLCVEDLTGKVNEDAPDSWLRSSAAADLLPRLRREAPDMLWMAQTTLERHGEALRRWGPKQYQRLLRLASMQCFLLGRRRAGARYAAAALRRAPLDPVAWSTLLLGLLGPSAVARGSLALRRRRATAAG